MPLARRLPEPIARPLRRVQQRLDRPEPPATPTLVVPPRHPSAPRPEPLAIPTAVEGRPPHSVWPAEPPPGYLGQLEPEFQRQIAARWADVRLEDCYFYHCTRLPDGRFLEGPWDLIDNESEYIGGVDVSGRSVLELGPASGWLTVWMTQQGAEVVVLDIGWDLASDLIPLATIDLEKAREDSIWLATQVENAWWYLRREYNHSARAVYAPILDLPSDLGRYDISLFGSVLLHLRDPFRALEQAARFTDDTIVVVEPLNVPLSDLDRPIMLWNPTRSTNWSGWWSFSPGVITDMLEVLGFPNTTVTFHRQLYRPPGTPESARVEATVFTVVARRN